MEAPLSSSSPSILINSCNTPKSLFQATVCLDDWWLVKAETDDLQGTRVAIGGRSVGNGVEGRQPMRVFSSLPILKRHDMFTLETTDGKCVIIKGLINEDRSAENGFPSDVLKHFMYGFPSYWKEYAKNFMIMESGCKGVSSVIENLSPLEGGQPHVGSCDNNIGLQDPMNANGMEMGGEALPTEEILSHTDSIKSNYSTRSSKLRLTKTSAKSGNEKIKSNSVNSSKASDKVELACVDIEPGGSIPEFQIEVGGQKRSENKKSLIKDVSSVIEKLSPLAVEQPHVGSCANNFGLQDPMKANGVEKREKEIPTEEILSHTEDSIRTRHSTRSSKLRLNKKSAKSGNEKIKSNSVTSAIGSGRVELERLEIEPGGGNEFHIEVGGQKRYANKKSMNKLDSGSVKDKFKQIGKTPNLEENLKEAITHGIMHKEMQKGPSSLSTLSAANNEKQTVIADSSSENAKASNKKSTKRLAYETPEKEKDKVPTDSPQYRSLNRSRSGRLLMPPLEFWRNQRAIHKADGTVIGFEEEIQEKQPKMGENSRSPFIRYRKI